MIAWLNTLDYFEVFSGTWLIAGAVSWFLFVVPERKARQGKQ